ncbi:MAG TPA: DUF6132 family protein [Ferruginibacter sp.]|nr:DUF6132 family protein [Ferruginibacter sp.]HRO05729.1 DUF6132 family protein [Ferruginibacter sp.]HRO97427.1 DUF6132 family protein [Ferruginibacter sp.]HRP49091.1 DUF6132 family protein [Ferruginibacter sp.]
MKKSIWITGLGILAGAVGGYLYYQYIGCLSGTCPITSRPMPSTLYGAVMGGLAFNLFVPNKKKKNSRDEGVM